MLESLLKQEKRVVAGGLVFLTALAWFYLLHLNRAMAMPKAGMADMPGMMMMPMTHEWTPADLLLTFLMWAVMMVGMMVPSAAPMILTFAAVNRQRATRGRPYVPAAIFLSGYLITWTAFSALAALAQWKLQTAALLDAHTQRAVPGVAGGLLLLAGLFQLTPWKNACLTRCRSPLDFLTTAWREGRGGAFRMGLEHGCYCVGCCWMLMTLLFVTGVMNLAWVAAIAAFVLAEKLLPYSLVVRGLGSAVCIAAGLAWIGRIFYLG
jgi:predicted metal-binding membrane protein